MQCPNCKAIISSDMNFCKRCGTKLLINQGLIPENGTSSEDLEEKFQCQVCGSLVLSKFKFCTECGAKLKKKQEMPSITHKNGLEPFPQEETTQKRTQELEPIPMLNTSQTSEIERINRQEKNDKNNLTPVKPVDSTQKNKAITIAKASLKAREIGEDIRAIELMEAALKIIIQEPEDSEIRQNTLDLIEQLIHSFKHGKNVND